MRQRTFNRVLLVFSLSLIGYYLTYRVLYTIPSEWFWFGILFFAAELHGAFEFFLFSFETWSPKYPEPKPTPDGLSVDIYVCTYNEDAVLLRKTILGTESIAYPHTTYICDDGNRPEVKQLAEDMGVRYIARSNNEHAKAGNINHALTQTEGDFIAILDADHVPLPDFLDRMLGYFVDPKVAFVQSPQTFYNLEAFEEVVDYETCQQWDESQAFFHLILPGKNRWNSAYFCGTGGIIRRQALEEVGGFATETITEDIHTSINMHAKGWKSVYIAEHMASGQAPLDLAAYHTQRTRWALGNLAVMFESNPMTRPGLSFAQRLSYLSSMIHWMAGFRKVVMYSMPIGMLLFNAYPITHITLYLIVLYFFQLSIQLFATFFMTRGRSRVFAHEVFAMLNFWVFTTAFIRAIFKLRAQKFEVTDKSGVTQFSIQSIQPHLVLLVVSVIAIWWGGLGIYYDTLKEPVWTLVAMFWCCWNGFFALYAILMATRPLPTEQVAQSVDHIPVLYRPVDSSEPEHIGLTTRYGDHGMTFTTYERLDIGVCLDTTLVLRFFRLPVQIEIIGCVSQDQADGLTYQYTCRFVDLDSIYCDMLNTHTMLYAVPRLLDDLGRHGRLLLHEESWSWLSSKNHRMRRFDYPINLEPKHNDWSHVRVIDIVGQEGTIVGESELAPDGLIDFSMATPKGIVEGALSVVSSHDTGFHGGPMWESRIVFEKLTKTGEELLRELTHD